MEIRMEEPNISRHKKIFSFAHMIFDARQVGIFSVQNLQKSLCKTRHGQFGRIRMKFNEIRKLSLNIWSLLIEVQKCHLYWTNEEHVHMIHLSVGFGMGGLVNAEDELEVVPLFGIRRKCVRKTRHLDERFWNRQREMAWQHLKRLIRYNIYSRVLTWYDSSWHDKEQHDVN